MLTNFDYHHESLVDLCYDQKEFRFPLIVNSNSSNMAPRSSTVQLPLSLSSGIFFDEARGFSPRQKVHQPQPQYSSTTYYQNSPTSLNTNYSSNTPNSTNNNPNTAATFVPEWSPLQPQISQFSQLSSFSQDNSSRASSSSSSSSSSSLSSPSSFSSPSLSSSPSSSSSLLFNNFQESSNNNGRIGSNSSSNSVNGSCYCYPLLNIDYSNLPSSQASYHHSGLSTGTQYNNLPITCESPPQWSSWENFSGDNRLSSESSSSCSSQSLESDSPTSTYLEVTSFPSSNVDNQWLKTEPNFSNPESDNNVWLKCEPYTNLENFQNNKNSTAAAEAIFNPSQTLHLRTNSDSSISDEGIGQMIETLGANYEDFSYTYSSNLENRQSIPRYLNSLPNETLVDNNFNLSTAALPISHQMSSPPPPSSSIRNSLSNSPSTRRNSSSRLNSTNSRVTKTIMRRAFNTKKNPEKNADRPTEKRVGKRRGPLLPEQRKQASEIRKLRACLRCKFLKKTCDIGLPCTGCQPSHARLWQVPCTRIDIKDIAYFMKDWKADHERLIGRRMSLPNVKGCAQNERLIWITHGYGFSIPVLTHEVFVADDNSFFTVGWVESIQKEPFKFNTCTEKISAGPDGISTEALSEYLDKHLEGSFENFLDEHFEGTPFITDILKTAHRYYVKEQVPVIRKALKLVLAYNLTLHITLVEQHGEEFHMDGLVNNNNSKFNGRIIAPVLINFQIKCALADMWRDLQKEVLAELSALYSSVYSGDRLKNWPTIFMIASILLAVWEEMQFDSHYRVPDPVAVNKFCKDMETTPVGVIVGLFHAISQKLPSFTEWDTRRHGQLLNNNMAVCEAMTEMKVHVTKHENYLRTRPNAQFDSRNFDCLSNKFLSKLVIRAN